MRKMRILAMGMCAAMTLSLAACGGGSSSSMCQVIVGTFPFSFDV